METAEIKVNHTYFMYRNRGIFRFCSLEPVASEKWTTQEIIGNLIYKQAGTSKIFGYSTPLFDCLIVELSSPDLIPGRLFESL